MREKAGLSIGTVARLTGIPVGTLRTWEKRYGISPSARTSGNQRLYSREDVALLNYIAGLVRQGGRIGEIVSLIRDSHVSHGSSYFNSEPFTEQFDALIQALLEFDRSRIETILDSLSQILFPIQMLEHVYGPALKVIGEYWETKNCTVAQEHFSSAVLRQRISAYWNIPSLHLMRGQLLPQIVLATLQGELHEGGILLLGAILRLQSYSVTYLGSSLPLDDLAWLVHNQRPTILGLSFFGELILHRYLNMLGELDIPVCIGGPAANLVSKLGESNKLFLCTTAGAEAARQIAVIAQNAVAGGAPT